VPRIEVLSIHKTVLVGLHMTIAVSAVVPFAESAVAAEGARRQGASRHRIAVAAGLGTVANSAGVDGHYENSRITPSVRAGYSLRIVPGFEFGADASYWRSAVRDTAFHTAILAAVVRPFLPLGARESVEIGASVRFGAFIMYLPDALPPASPTPVSETWRGVGGTISPDVRVWLASHWAIQFAAELALGKGQNPTDPTTQGLYLSKDGALFALGTWIGCVVGF
jgi:hypothetical protein